MSPEQYYPDYERTITTIVSDLEETFRPENYGWRKALTSNRVDSTYFQEDNCYQITLRTQDRNGKYIAYDCQSSTIHAQEMLRKQGIPSWPVVLGREETSDLFDTDIALQVPDGRLVRIPPFFPTLDKQPDLIDHYLLDLDIFQSSMKGNTTLNLRPKDDLRPLSYQLIDSHVHTTSLVGIDEFNSRGDLVIFYESVTFNDVDHTVESSYLYCLVGYPFFLQYGQQYSKKTEVGETMYFDTKKQMKKNGNFPLLKQDLKAIQILGNSVYVAKYV